MDITQNDITIVVAMTVGIILMSFAAPALGLTGERANESDVPEFSMDSDRFDFAGDFPSRPGSPSQSFLEYEERLGGASDNQVWMFGDTSGGLEFGLVSNVTTGIPEVNVNVWDGDSIDESQSEEFIFQNESDFAHWDRSVSFGGETYEWEFRFDAEEIELLNGGTNGSNAVVSYTVTEQPEGESWYERIPVIGGVLSAGADIAGMVGWIGAIIQWAAVTFFEVILNALGMVVDLLAFLFGLLNWLSGTYTALVGGAPSAWASVVLSIPGVLLAVELAKITAVAVHVIWIG